MATKSNRVRIQNISVSMLQGPNNPATYNIGLAPTTDQPGGMGFNFVTDDLTDLVVGKEYDWSLTPAAAAVKA